MRLLIDAAAWRDLDAIARWIARDNQVAARRVLGAILATIAQLERFPRLSRPGRVAGTQERVVAGTPYIVVLEISEPQATVVITAVAHGARNRPPTLD